MLRTILVPLDGTALAEQVLPCAERLAEIATGKLVLCRIVPPNVIQSAEKDLDTSDEAHTYIRNIGEQLASRGCQVETVVEWGMPAASIVAQVPAYQADVVLIATHARSGPGRLVFGSVADEVVRTSSVPVLLVPPTATPSPSFGRLARVLVPLDGSELAESVLQPIVELARQFAAQIVLLRVVPFPPLVLYGNAVVMLAGEAEQERHASETYLSQVAERLAAQGVTVRMQADVADPHGAIAHIAQAEKVDLVAMATHGRSGLARLAFGSVATATLRRTHVPLLLFGPAALSASVSLSVAAHASRNHASQWPGVVPGRAPARDDAPVAAGARKR